MRSTKTPKQMWSTPQSGELQRRVAASSGFMGMELLDSISRFSRWINDKAYFEHDAAFLAYRNALGRHCGRAADAAHAATPIRPSPAYGKAAKQNCT